MWLPYRYGFMIAAACALVVLIMRRVRHPLARTLASTLHEVGIVMVLYGIWQYVRKLAVTKSVGAVEHARTLWDVQRWMHLPSEATLQSLVIDNRPIMWFLNAYYGVAHVPAAAALLIWVFWKHRAAYSTIRATFALSIAGCIAIQAWLPMAPPRFLTDLGFVDAGLKYDMSVYGTGGDGLSNQVAAMPSMHWAWAILVAVGVWRLAGTRWRWVGVLHLLLTAAAVTLTANHWWLDGAVAGLVVAVAFAVQRVVRTAFARRRDRPEPSSLVASSTSGGELVDTVPVARPLSNV